MSVSVENSTVVVKSTIDQSKQLEPPMSSSSFSEYITRLVTGRVQPSKEAINMTTDPEKKQLAQDSSGQNKLLSNPAEASASSQQSQPQPPASQSPNWPKRSCRAPLSRKFAHPCTCGQANSHHKHQTATNNSTGPLPPAAFTNPLHLYDPHTKKCLPIARNRDMLLKECQPVTRMDKTMGHGFENLAACVYSDLVCDRRRNRCTCKPSLHLYYESNLSSFGCVPIGPTSSPDNRINCRSGYVYNVISRDCQKIFDISEIPPSYTTGVSATQFSFVTIVLIWILLLILIVTAKLRKLRTSNLYRNSPTTERRLHSGGGGNSYRNHHQSQTASTWLHPFIAAVNGHHHLNQHRTTVDRHGQTVSHLDESGNYNDTDFFLSNGNLGIGDNNFVGSQQSLNNPPPKFEEIYPSCPEEHRQTETFQPPPSNEDLPSYDEAMKLQNTTTIMRSAQ